MPFKGKLIGIAFFLISGLALLLAACGGEGSGTAGSGSGDSALGVFFTDNLSADYEHVWVTAYKVELASASDKVTLLEDSEGQEIDLRSLTGADGNEFLFMGSASIPKGTYTKVLITVAKNSQLIAKDSDAAVSAPFAASLDSGDRSQLELALDPPLAVTGASHDLVVDFDLAEWKFEGGFVTPVVKRHDGTGLDNLNRHRGHEYRGVVSSLTGTSPEMSFVLSMGGKRVQVVCTPDTKYLSVGPETETPSLADGQLVEVKAVFDVLTRSLRAQTVLIKTGPVPEREAKVKGGIKEPKETEGTFMTIPRIVRGFMPSRRLVKVSVTDATKFLNAAGRTVTKAEFFAALTSDKVIVESLGTWQAEGSVLNAASVMLSDGEVRAESSAQGVIKTANKEEGLLVLLGEGLTLEGFAPPEGMEIRLNAQRTTLFRDADGGVMTREQFFAKALAGVKVKGLGSQAEGVVNCRLIEIVEVQPPAVGGSGANVLPDKDISTI